MATPRGCLKSISTAFQRLARSGDVERFRANVRSDHPREVPHIRQTTWGIPRTWFVLVVEDERELYEVSGQTSVRYRAHRAWP